MDRLELSSYWNPFTKQVRWRSWGFWETSAIEWICIIQILNLAIKCHLHMFTFIGKFSLRRSAPCYLIYFSYQINLPKLRMRFRWNRYSPGRREKCVPLQFLNSYIFFSVSLKFAACYITVQWGEFSVNNATLYLHIFLAFLLLLFIDKNMHLSFSFLFSD